MHVSSNRLSIQADWKSLNSREFGGNVLSCPLKLPPPISCGAKGVAEIIGFDLQVY